MEKVISVTWFDKLTIHHWTRQVVPEHSQRIILSGIDTKSLLQAVDTAVELCKDGHHGIPVPDYVDENVSTKVVKIVQSYVGIVNKMVWRK